MSFFGLFCIFYVVFFTIYSIGFIVPDIYIKNKIQKAKEKDPDFLTFDKFCEWANYRAMDGCWNLNVAIQATSLIEEVNKQPKRKRDEYWEDNYAEEVKESLIRIYGTNYMRPGKEE